MISKSQAYRHQLVSLKHNDKTPIVFDLSDAGTGKTYVRIMAFAKRRAKKSGCMLVFAPRTLLRNVWLADFRKFAPHLKVAVCDADNRIDAFNQDADVYVTNHDATKFVAKQKAAFFKKFSEIVVDESTAYKHHTAQRSKAVARITKHFKFRCCMTATPNGNTITDVWHQALLLDDGKRLGTSFYKFRDSVCAPKQVGPQSHMVKWLDKDGAEEAVFNLLSDIVVRHSIDSLPENVQYAIDYELSPKQLKAYVELEATQILTTSANKITAINAAAVMTKLLQVSSGAVYDGTGKYHLVDTARYDMILDLVEARKHCLVFFFWNHQRDQLVAAAEKRGLSFCVMDGNTSDKAREELVTSYQAGVFKVMFAHPKSAAHGLTLTRGTSTIWTCPTYDLEIFKQGSKRQHRIGQTQKTENVVVVAKGTIEQEVYDKMLGKDARMSNLLDLFGSLYAQKSNIVQRTNKEAVPA